jgi:hypothetical protein
MNGRFRIANSRGRRTTDGRLPPDADSTGVAPVDYFGVQLHRATDSLDMWAADDHVISWERPRNLRPAAIENFRLLRDGGVLAE